MDHDAIRHKLSEYLDGSVNDREKTLIEAHLKTCERCSDALQELQKTIAHIKTIEEMEPPAWMKQKIMAQVRADAEKKNWVQRFFLPLSIKLPLQAIAVVFLVIGVFYIYRSNQPAPLPSEAPIQKSSAERLTSKPGPAKDQLAKAYSTSPREKQVLQAPEYKALDMKQEYEKPASPALSNQAGAPAPSMPGNQPMMAKKKAAIEQLAATPQAGNGPKASDQTAAELALQSATNPGSSVREKRSAAARSADQSVQCLTYEPTINTMAGTISKKDFPGRPNYESIDQGDERETVWILRLDKAICIRGDNNDVTEGESNITEVQLVLNAAQYDKYRSLLAKPVLVQGTFSHAHTGHHHTSILMNVQSISARAREKTMQNRE